MPVSAEEPKRLKPTPETLRQLFLLSGNLCAFEGCTHPILDNEGVYVAELCHIEAALPEGERFNEEMTNEERRHASNLLLMCLRHHKVTDDVVRYPTARMKEIKSRHESRFSEGIDRMLTRLSDQTLGNVVTSPSTMDAIYEYKGWLEKRDEEDLAFTLEVVSQLAERLRTLSDPARDVLLIILTRGRRVPSADRAVLIREISDVTGATPPDIIERVGQLEAQEFAYCEFEYGFDEMAGPFAATIRSRSDWPTLIDIVEFVETKDLDLSAVIRNLDFSVLD